MKILVIDDDPQFHMVFKQMIESAIPRPIVISAYNLTDAKTIYEKHRDVKVIIMDGCLDSAEPNTAPLVREIRKTYQGIIVANSSNEDGQKQLVEAGCRHASPSKKECAQFVLNIIKENPD